MFSHIVVGVLQTLISNEQDSNAMLSIDESQQCQQWVPIMRCHNICQRWSQGWSRLVWWMQICVNIELILGRKFVVIVFAPQPNSVHLCWQIFGWLCQTWPKSLATTSLPVQLDLGDYDDHHHCHHYYMIMTIITIAIIIVKSATATTMPRQQNKWAWVTNRVQGRKAWLHQNWYFHQQKFSIRNGAFNGKFSYLLDLICCRPFKTAFWVYVNSNMLEQI